MIKLRRLKFHNTTYAIEVTIWGKVYEVYLPRKYKG